MKGDTYRTSGKLLIWKGVIVPAGTEVIEIGSTILDGEERNVYRVVTGPAAGQAIYTIPGSTADLKARGMPYPLEDAAH